MKNDGVDERTSRHATWIDGRDWWIWFETKAVRSVALSLPLLFFHYREPDMQP